MVSDQKHAYDPLSDPPIPTYEEATSSLISARRGPQEASDDAERQGLLGHNLSAPSSNSRRRNGYYNPPSAVSDNSGSDDEGSELESPVPEAEDVALRETMEEMDILDPGSVEEGRSRRNRSMNGFSKRFYSIRHSLSSFHLPRIPWPSFDWLTHRLPRISAEYRPGWAILARLCGLILIIILVYFLVVSEIMPIGAGGLGQPFNPEYVRQKVQGSVDTWRIQDNLKYITSFDHVGGTEGSFFLGQWIENKFKEARMDTFAHDEYWVYMNYPKENGRRVAIVEPPEKVWEAKLTEESAYNPPVQQTATFHGLSASGNVTGPLIYVNYGHKADFKRLSDSGVDVKGAVVLVRFYGTQTDVAMKVKAAQDAGAAGVLIYSDPADDGFKKGAAWPAGRWRPEGSVQRGSVGLTSWIAGDVLTPGRPSTKDAERTSKDKNPALPTIPSIPLAWRDAKILLKSLNGIGEKLPEDWVGAVPDIGPDWYSGHPSKSPKVNLQNFQDEIEQQRIQNVFGSFIGLEDKAKKIIVGNHRDSWCFGAADPGSGTAVMLEVARVLGELRAEGWRPLRTIEFASWDAEEYNLIGSTEHVEANINDLRANAIAYLNVDVGVTGDKLWANGSPIFQNAWKRAIGRLSDPHSNRTLRETWDEDDEKIGGLAADSDYAAFAHMAGTSSLNFGFKGPEHGDMAHSCYETFDWIAKYVDPGLAYHNLLAQLWALIIIELAQEPILPLDLKDYAASLQESTGLLMDSAAKSGGKEVDAGIFAPLVDGVSAFVERARSFHEWEDVWYQQVSVTGGFESPGVTVQRLAHNSRIAGFETGLLDGVWEEDGDGSVHGLPGREQYKHIIYAPSLDGADQVAIFPFVADAIAKQDWALVKTQINKTAAILQRAVDELSR